ncbi:hypothetical protein [Verrucomicrobium sp. BvORR106]|uniref:hypothetical protein n=1 Tax=Verrucomicrobium sp. BvORR106 TaxID=1403819 RepID=UPI00056F5D92|nr:hypothetical protein [Verrucomicrobium sp. BvORR106]
MVDPVVLINDYDPVCHLSWSPAAGYVAAGTPSGRILVWAREEGSDLKFRTVLDQKDAPALGLVGKVPVSVAVNDSALFASYEDQVWRRDLSPRGEWHEFALSGGVLSLSPQGRRLLIGHKDAVDANSREGVTGRKHKKLWEDAKVTAVAMVDDRLAMIARHEDEDYLSINPYGHYEHTGGSSTRWISWLDTLSLESGGDDAAYEKMDGTGSLVAYAEVLSSLDRNRLFGRERVAVSARKGVASSQNEASHIRVWYKRWGWKWTQHEVNLCGEAMSLSRDSAGARLAVLRDGVCEVWDTEAMRCMQTWRADPDSRSGASPVSQAQQNRFVSLAISSEGRRVVLADRRGKVAIYSVDA